MRAWKRRVIIFMIGVATIVAASSHGGTKSSPSQSAADTSTPSDSQNIKSATKTLRANFNSRAECTRGGGSSSAGPSVVEFACKEAFPEHDSYKKCLDDLSVTTAMCDGEFPNGYG